MTEFDTMVVIKSYRRSGIFLNKIEIKELFKNKNFGKILYDEDMKNHTTFKIGGPVDIMIIPTREEEIINCVKFLRNNDMDFLIMGNGSNLLVRDGGIRGIVVKIAKEFSKIDVEGNTMYSQAGALLSTVSDVALKHSLKNFEFASGIPGTIGGAITMNAGAYGGEMKDVVKKVRVLDKDNNIKEYTNEEMDFRYRNSRVVEDGLIILGIELNLKNGDYKHIKETIDDLTYRRRSKQPLEYPSGGSTFKRPEGYYAGKLIDDSGLRGLRHGGAMVSEKHCGFIINADNAKCKDVLYLISVIQKVVKDKFGVELQREIKLLGED